MKFIKDKEYLRRRILIKPFIYKRESLGTQGIKLTVLLSVQVLMLILTKSYDSVVVIACAALASFLSNLFVSKCFDQNIHFSTIISIVQGILIGMLVPGSYPPVSVFFAVFISMLISKYVFGGFSFTWINPVVFTVLVLWFTGGSLFPDFSVTKDILSLRNPSQSLIENGTFPVNALDSGITDFLNSTIFSFFKVSVPEGYVSMFWDTHSVIPAFRFNFISIISSLFIFCTDLYKVIIPMTFTFVYILLVRLVSPVFTESVPMHGDMLLALLTSGTLFTSIFVLGNLSTAPVSIKGKILYAVIAGITAFLVCGCGTSSIGLMFTVLIADLFSMIIQRFEDHFNNKAVKKFLIQNNLNSGETA